MIFASDLDQTLIFSVRFLTEQLGPTRLVEELDGNPISYMTENSVRLLKELHQRVMFVPVTTRTIEQFQRIHIFHTEIKPVYAITSNGGNVLIDGIIDVEWNKKIKQRINHECLDIDTILKQFNKIRDDAWLLSEKTVEELFHYCMIDRNKLPHSELESFGQWIDEQNWSMSIQGRKLYLVPKVVNKRDAVLYISERENKDSCTVAAGDSLLDLPLLEYAHYSLVPPHGEINNLPYEKKHQLHFTASRGISASEEILEKALMYFEQLVR